MAVRRILEIPHPILRQRAKRVRNVDSDVLKLAYDMVDTMRHASGVGLAANQVGDLRRVIVIQLPDEEEARIYINPEIVHREGEREVEEGCLSVPGYRGFIKRALWVRFRALDHEAQVVKLKADELLAQALEHEVDHLNGILYLDHLESHEKLIKIDEQQERGAQPVEDGTGGTHPSAVRVPSDEEVARYGDASTPEADPRETPASLKIK